MCALATYLVRVGTWPGEACRFGQGSSVAAGFRRRDFHLTCCVDHGDMAYSVDLCCAGPGGVHPG